MIYEIWQSILKLFGRGVLKHTNFWTIGQMRSAYWRRGIEYGYPSCCIQAFVDDCVHGRHPGLRGLLNGRVPCERCKEGGR